MKVIWKILAALFAVVALLFSFVYHPKIGLINAGLKLIGLGGLTHAWTGSTDTAIFPMQDVLERPNRNLPTGSAGCSTVMRTTSSTAANAGRCARPTCTSCAPRPT